MGRAKVFIKAPESVGQRVNQEIERGVISLISARFSSCFLRMLARRSLTFTRGLSKNPSRNTSTNKSTSGRKRTPQVRKHGTYVVGQISVTFFLQTFSSNGKSADRTPSTGTFTRTTSAWTKNLSSRPWSARGRRSTLRRRSQDTIRSSRFGGHDPISVNVAVAPPE